MKRRTSLMVLIVLAALASCGGEDYALTMVKKADMHTVARASYKVSWEDKLLGEFFKTKAGQAMTVGDVAEAAGEKGRVGWRVTKISDSVRVVETNIVTFLDKKIRLTFRVNVESGEVTLDDLELQSATAGGITRRGVNFDSLEDLSIHASK